MRETEIKQDILKETKDWIEDLKRKKQSGRELKEKIREQSKNKDMEEIREERHNRKNTNDKTTRDKKPDKKIGG